MILERRSRPGPPEIVRTRIETAFYPASDLLSAGLTEAELSDRIRQELGENHFGEGRGGLHVDRASSHLIAPP